MFAFKQVIAALAVCSLFVTTLALPASPLDATLALIPKDTANSPPPTSCTVEENATYDNYGITVPTGHSDAKCNQARDAIAEFTADFKDAWVCQPYGDWTIMFFSAEKGTAEKINKAMSTIFTHFTFQCANSDTVQPSLVKKGDPIATGAQSCHATAHGAYNSYTINIGEPYDGGRCDTFKSYLWDQSLALLEFQCWKDFHQQTTVTFKATVYRAGQINESAHKTWPEVNGFNCPDW